MMIVTAALLLLGQASPTARNEEWDVVGYSELDDVSIKPTSARILSDGKRQIWVRYKRKKVSEVHAMMMLERYDCANETSASVSIVHYRKDGTVLANRSFTNYELKYQPVIPDSVNATVMGLVCVDLNSGK